MTTIVIDVRETYEFVGGHVPGALNIPPSELLNGAKDLEGVQKDTQLILYCRSGSRSNSAMQILQQYGFTNMINGINKDHVMTKYAELIAVE
jgi:phage shock protein E